MPNSKSASSRLGEGGPDPDPGLERASARWRWRVPYLRWWIGGLLFASTTINYIDRQTLSVLAPYLKAEKHWTNTDFATIIIAFRISYSFLQFLSLGTR
jgi:sugar phosphate permease